VFDVEAPLTKKMVACYAHFYWNVSKLSGAGELEETLRDWYDHDRLMKVYYGGELQALFLAGLNPKIVDPRIAMRECHRQLYFDLVGLRSAPTTSENVRARTAIAKELRGLYTQVFDSEGQIARDELMKIMSNLRLISRRHGHLLPRRLWPISWTDEPRKIQNHGSFA
jgi:hypothetical protein